MDEIISLLLLFADICNRDTRECTVPYWSQPHGIYWWASKYPLARFYQVPSLISWQVIEKKWDGYNFCYIHFSETTALQQVIFWKGSFLPSLSLNCESLTWICGCLCFYVWQKVSKPFQCTPPILMSQFTPHPKAPRLRTGFENPLLFTTFNCKN